MTRVMAVCWRCGSDNYVWSDPTRDFEVSDPAPAGLIAELQRTDSFCSSCRANLIGAAIRIVKIPVPALGRWDTAPSPT
jgi:hypothetical protein